MSRSKIGTLIGSRSHRLPKPTIIIPVLLYILLYEATRLAIHTPRSVVTPGLFIHERMTAIRLTVGSDDEAGGIVIRDTVTVNTAGKKIYAALTGDQVALTGIRIR